MAKKTLAILIYADFCLLSAELLGTVIAALFGYKWRMNFYAVYAACTAVLTAITAISAFIINEKLKKTASGMALILPFYAILSGFLTVVRERNAFVAVCVICTFLACFAISAKVTEATCLNVAALILFMLLATVVSLASVFAVLIPGRTVIMSVESPDSRYVAEVVDGSDIYVEVKPKDINIGIATLSKPSERIWEGEYYQIEKLRISWQNDEILNINGLEYEIK